MDFENSVTEPVDPAAELVDIDFEERYAELAALVETKQMRAVRDILREWPEVDIAWFLEELSPEQAVLLFRMLPKEAAAEVFANLEPENQQHIISAITESELSAIVEELAIDDAVDMLEELPASVVHRVLKLAQPDTRKLLNQFLKYPDNSAGSIMTAEFVNLRPSMTVKDAFAHIRKHGADSETIYTCYVIDSARHLTGVVTVKALLLADGDQTIEDIMDENVIYCTTADDQEEVTQIFSKYGFIALPVVDGENRLVGIVTVDDVITVMEDEATEDMEKMAAMLPSEHPYMRSTPIEIWKNRIPWLLLLMVSATLTGIVITKFEDSLAVLPCLTAFIPMLMDTGGNSGSQACVSIIRGISLNEIEFRDLGKVVWKEIRVSVLCGVCLAVACFAKIVVVDMLLLKSESVSYMVAFVVCATMAVTVCLAKIVGSTLPLLAKKLGFDPAVMASPIITTIVDFLSLLVYFAFATAMLGIG